MDPAARRLTRLGIGLTVAFAVSASAATNQDPQEKTAGSTRKAATGKAGKSNSKSKAKSSATRPTMAEDATQPAIPEGASADLTFSRDIAPILVANCAGCHKAAHRSGLDQTTFASLIKGGKAGPAIVAGNPDESLLVSRIKGEDGPKMPPGNARLSDTAIGKIERWVKEGARLDPGKDPAGPMAKYAATPDELRKAELAKLSPADRDKKAEAAARDRLKRADPKSDLPLTSGDHFLLFADMPKDRATALLKTMEAQYKKVNALLGSGGPGLNFGEKVGIYVFKDEKGLSEFARTIENQDLETGEQARGRLGVESPYLIALDPAGGGPEPLSSAAPIRKGGRPKKADDSGTFGPERSLAGLLSEQLAAGAVARSGKPPRWLTGGVGALVGSQVEPRSPYYRRLRVEAYDQWRQGWPTRAQEALGDQTKPEAVKAVGFAILEWLNSAYPRELGPFVAAMIEGGAKLDDAITGCFNGTREAFLAGSGEFVSTRYGGGR